MPQNVIEGTWEEIERHKAEFVGHILRLTIKSKAAAKANGAPPARTTPKVNELRARGMLAGILSSEDYFREKREDMLREDPSL